MPVPDQVAAPSSRRMLWWLLGGFGCLSLLFFGACAVIAVLTLFGQRVSNSPTASTTTSPLAATASPPAVGNASGADASQISGELLLEDDFSDEATSNLDISEDETSRSAYEDGAYVLEVKEPEMVVWSIVDGPYAGVSIEVETAIPASSDITAAGVIFNYQDSDNFYLYTVSNDGYYQLEALINGEWVTLIDPTLSDAVKGTHNTLRLTTRGDHIALYANGVLLEETLDDTFTSGDIGLAVSTFQESTGTVYFDNLSVVRDE